MDGAKFKFDEKTEKVCEIRVTQAFDALKHPKLIWSKFTFNSLQLLRYFTQSVALQWKKEKEAEISFPESALWHTLPF